MQKKVKEKKLTIEEIQRTKYDSYGREKAKVARIIDGAIRSKDVKDEGKCIKDTVKIRDRR